MAVTEEQPSPRPAVKWRPGEIPQSPGEATDASASAQAWRTKPSRTIRKRK